MCKGYLYVLPLHVHDRIERFARHLITQQVLKSVSRYYPPAIEHYRQPRIEVRIVAQHRLHYIIVERIVLKQTVIRLEVYVRTRLVGGGFRGVAYQFSILKLCRTHITVAVASHLKLC